MRVSMIALAAAVGLIGFFSPPALAQEPTKTFVLDTTTGAVTERLSAVEKDHAELKQSQADLATELADLRKQVQALQRSASPPASAVAAAPPLSLPEATCKCGPACPKGGCLDCECPPPSAAASAKPGSGKRLVQVCDGKSCRLVEVGDGPTPAVQVAGGFVEQPTTVLNSPLTTGTCSATATATRAGPIRRILGFLVRRCR